MKRETKGFLKERKYYENTYKLWGIFSGLQQKVEEFNQENEKISKRKKAHLKSLEVAKKTLGLLPFTIVAEATINNMVK